MRRFAWAWIHPASPSTPKSKSTSMAGPAGLNQPVTDAKKQKPSFQQLCPGLKQDPAHRSRNGQGSGPIHALSEYLAPPVLTHPRSFAERSINIFVQPFSSYGIPSSSTLSRSRRPAPPFDLLGSASCTRQALASFGPLCHFL